MPSVHAKPEPALAPDPAFKPTIENKVPAPSPAPPGMVWITGREWISDFYRPDTYASMAATSSVTRNPRGPSSSYDPDEPGTIKRCNRGGSFLCTDQYCTRYMLGTRGKAEVRSSSNHMGFRCVRVVVAK